MVSEDERKQRQDAITADYDEANRLNRKRLPDLADTDQLYNQATEDFLIAVRRNTTSTIAQPPAVDADQDGD